MNIGLLFALQEHGAAAEARPASPFDVNFGLFFWTLVVFLILLAVLWKYAWPGILKATEEREQKIKGQLADAERLNGEAKTALLAAQALQAEARASAQAMIGEAKAVMEKERAAAVDKVKAEQDALVDRARRDIVAERDKAISELRREAVDLAIGAAAKVIGKRLDSDADKQIVLDYLAKVETH